MSINLIVLLALPTENHPRFQQCNLQATSSQYIGWRVVKSLSHCNPCELLWRICTWSVCFLDRWPRGLYFPFSRSTFCPSSFKFVPLFLKVLFQKRNVLHFNIAMKTCEWFFQDWFIFCWLECFDLLSQHKPGWNRSGSWADSLYLRRT